MPLEITLLFFLDGLNGVSVTNNMSLVCCLHVHFGRLQTQELDLVPLESCLLLVKLRHSCPLEEPPSSAVGRWPSWVVGFSSVLAKASENSTGLLELSGDRCPATEAVFTIFGLRISSCLSGSLGACDCTNFLIASSRYCSKHLKNSASCGPFHFMSRSRLSLALLCL